MKNALVGADRSVLARIVPELARLAGPTDDPDAPHLAQARLFDRLVGVIQRMASTRRWSSSSRTSTGPIRRRARSSNTWWRIPATPRASWSSRPYPDRGGRDAIHPFASVLRSSTAMPGGHPMISLSTLRPGRASRTAPTGILGDARRPTDCSPQSTPAPRATRCSPRSWSRPESHSPDAARLDRRRATVSDGGPLARHPARPSRRRCRRTHVFLSTSCARSRRSPMTELGRRAPRERSRRTPRTASRRQGYRFRHALLQEAIYDERFPGSGGGCTPRWRSPWRRIPIFLRRMPSSHRGSRTTSMRPAEFGRAFRTSRAAAVAAERQSAYIEALGHYERLLELWDQPGGRQWHVTRASIHERAARSAYLAGALPRSAIHGRQAIATLDVTPDDSLKIRVLDQLARTSGSIGEDAFQVNAQIAAMNPDGRPLADQVMILSARGAKASS